MGHLSFDMGAYAQFIWPAYGISVLGLALAALLTWRGWRAAKARLAHLEQSLEQNRP